MHPLTSRVAGIYIHIPFCIRKCPYCDFFSITDLDKIASFIHAAKKEIQFSDSAVNTIDTLYFGGGTPSVLAPECISELIRAVSKRFLMHAQTEVTLEVNPGTVTLDRLIKYRNAGINRLNIGVQSFQDSMLSFLGRIHTAQQAMDCIYMARQAEFDNLGVDLIYGLPGQTEQMWESELKTALTFSPEHLSCYLLTYEHGTKLTADLENGRIRALGDEKIAALFALTGDLLGGAGYIHYEISNYARSLSFRSRHNLKYWSFAPYIGIGPSAHSYGDNRRCWNVRSVDEYLERIGAGQSCEDGYEILDEKQQIIETVYLEFRCAEGISLVDFENRFALDFVQKFGGVISQFEPEGYLSVSEKHCRLTPKGMLFLDSIAGRFIQEI